MARKEYKFNPQTLTWEVISAPFRIRFYRFVRKLLIGFLLVCVFNFVFSYFFYTPKMYRIESANRELILQYALLEDKIHAATNKILEIKQRDNNVYRALFAADTLSIPGVYAPYPASKYAPMAADQYAALMVGTWKDLDVLGRLIYLESKSLDDLQPMARDKGLMALAVPATWPLDRRLIRGKIGTFGMRNHPILRRYIPHTGVDMGGPVGTPIYATANGRVVVQPGNGSGYGKQVLIDHGFGYRTRYAHLSEVLVEPGQMVVRGEQVGELGNTGRSTGPHLHYEVIYRGEPVDPMNYLRRDMSEADFEAILENAAATTYEDIDAPVHEE